MTSNRKSLPNHCQNTKTNTIIIWDFVLQIFQIQNRNVLNTYTHTQTQQQNGFIKYNLIKVFLLCAMEIDLLPEKVFVYDTLYYQTGEQS